MLARISHKPLLRLQTRSNLPLERYPDTYNDEPLMYAAAAAQKRHYSVYLTGVYQDPERMERLKERFKEVGKRIDMGKSCIRFRKLEDILLDLIGEEVAADPVDEFIERYEEIRG